MTAIGTAPFEPHASYRLGDQMVLRREAFGALAYDLRTRALRVLRDPDLVMVLERLDDSASAAQALEPIDPGKHRQLLAALAKLEREGVIGVDR